MSYALFRGHRAFFIAAGILTLMILSLTAETRAAVTPGATIPELTGFAYFPGLPDLDTNPADFGKYNAPGGNGLIGGPLLTDAQAAYFVVATPSSTVETGPKGAANAAANNYFNFIATNNPESYLSQLQSADGFWTTAASWGGVTPRIDGACPMANPTTAEVLQWAANKWGISPVLLYAEATEDGDWDNTSLGDWSDGIGCSSGVCQVADRNTPDSPNHAFAGFAGAGAMLSRENTCFNADFFAAHIYAAFHGLTGECPAGDIGAAIQSWLVGQTSGPGSYTDLLYGDIVSQAWSERYFAGAQVPY